MTETSAQKGIVVYAVALLLLSGCAPQMTHAEFRQQFETAWNNGYAMGRADCDSVEARR